ncbi:hypothetical protein F4780DRAFT_438888 [Xylariomycetidae sp. FL0641]|nr:hypothetical protein F4780DRAFT_438888 [Xylariomycetidae sp. FL0641]
MRLADAGETVVILSISAVVAHTLVLDLEGFRVHCAGFTLYIRTLKDNHGCHWFVESERSGCAKGSQKPTNDNLSCFRAAPRRIELECRSGHRQ